MYDSYLTYIHVGFYMYNVVSMTQVSCNDSTPEKAIYVPLKTYHNN